MDLTLRRIAVLALALGLAFAAWTAPVAHADEPPILAATCPQGLILGAVFDCAIGAAGELDSYQFQGATNDRLIFRAARTSGAYTLKLRVRDANDNQICADVSGTRAIADCTLTSSGTFTLEISDYYGQSTGNYLVYAQRLNAPSGAQAAAFGTIRGGSVGYGIESDTYSFSAEINDQIELRLRRLSGSFTPQLSVYDSGGTRVCNDVAAVSPRIAPCTIKTTGMHYVVVEDYYASTTGSYEWTLQRWGRSGGVVPITLGGVYEGTLATPIESDVFTFQAAQNDQVILRAQRSAGDMTMYIRVFDSAGNLICSNARSTQARIEPCTLASAGVYSAMIDDYYGTNTGTYVLHTQRINNPGQAPALAFGRTVSGALDRVAALDTYTFTALQNAVISLKATRSAGGFTPYVRVYNAGGALVCSDAGTAEASIPRCAISATGRYTVIVDDYYGQSVGTYTLALGCVTGPCTPTPPRTRTYLPQVVR